MLHSSQSDHRFLTPELRKWREGIYSQFRLFREELQAGVAQREAEADAAARKPHESRAMFNPIRGYGKQWNRSRCWMA